MSANFRTGDTVNTPNGPAVFIGYFRDGLEAQVSQRVPATIYTRDECETRKPAVKEMTRAEFEAWQKTAKFLINKIYLVSDLR